MGLDFQGLNRFLLGRSREIVSDLLPGGELIGNEYTCADLRGGAGRSLKVNIASGMWADFATGDKGGDLVSLAAAAQSLDQGMAYTFLSETYGYTNGHGNGSNGTSNVHVESAKVSVPQESDLVPPPLDAPPPKLGPLHWEYKDFDGRLMFFTERYDYIDKKGKPSKGFRPWSWSKSKGEWIDEWWKTNRPIYGLELLAQNLTKPILIVEGEKTADAARHVIKSYTVVTWSGGSGTVLKTDWAPIYGRANVLLWPDADLPGLSAMTKLGERLVGKVGEMKVLDVDGMPDKWDAADAFGDWDYKAWAEWAKPRAKVFEVKRVKPDVSVPNPTEFVEAVERAAAWPGEFGFYDMVEAPTTKDPDKVKFVPMYNELAKWCFKNKGLCFTDKEQLKYDGRKWEWLEKHELSNLLVKWNKDYLQPAHHDNFIKQLRATCYMKALGINPESAAGHLNVDNGVVKISDGSLLPHDYRFRFRYCAPIKYDPLAECPRWEQFLMDTFDGNIELIDLAQRLFGYVLIGGRPFLHRAFVLYGSGRNGKSTFLDVLRAIIGRDAYSVVSMAKLEKEFSLVSLEGKLANIVEETPNDAINAEVFKTLVGGGEITVAHKGFDEYQLRCDARFVFACNEMPIFKDKTVGLEERLIFMPFNRYIPEEERDTLILDKLYAELPGILNWALFGAKIMTNERMIPKYEILNSSKENYKIETNPLYAWFKDELIVSKTAEGVPVGDAYKRYSQDMIENGNRPFSKDRFSKLMRKYIEIECRVKGVIYEPDLKSKDQKTRLYSAVCFRVEKSEKPDSYDRFGKKLSRQKVFDYGNIDS